MNFHRIGWAFLEAVLRDGRWENVSAPSRCPRGAVNHPCGVMDHTLLIQMRS